jgi:hypothetical protein
MSKMSTAGLSRAPHPSRRTGSRCRHIHPVDSAWRFAPDSPPEWFKARLPGRESVLLIHGNPVGGDLTPSVDERDCAATDLLVLLVRVVLALVTFGLGKLVGAGLGV